jgi:hypothetical protein
MDSVTAANIRLLFRLTAFQIERWWRDDVNRSGALWQKSGDSELGLGLIEYFARYESIIENLGFPMQEHTRMRLESNLWQVNVQAVDGN